MNSLDHYEQLARQYGSPNCWTGTTGSLAAAILELVTEIKLMTDSERIPNAVALIHRIKNGNSAQRCIASIGDIEPKVARRWLGALEGAEVAWYAIGREDLSSVAVEVEGYLETLAAKECNCEQLNSSLG